MEWTPRVFFFLCAGLFSLYLFFHLLGNGTPPRAVIPAPSKHQFQRIIVAVGDLHGDYPNMMTVLKMADVVTEHGKWSGKVDFLVQTGDIVDRGDDTIKMYHYMEELRGEARRAGGDVISHLGNHEVMNLIGDWRYVLPSEIRTFGGTPERQHEISQGFIGRAWRSNYTITTRLPLHPLVGKVNTDYDASKDASMSGLSHAALSFLHGGLSPSYKNLTPYPSAINDIGRTLVNRLQDRKVQPPPHPPNPYPGLPSDVSKEEDELYQANGPLWYRGWATDKEAVVCKLVDGVLKKLGVRRLIMGHTPNFTGMVTRCNGKIILIDTGISHAYGGVLSAARFTYTITPSGGSDHAKERELVETIYQDKTVLIADDEREVRGKFL